MAGATAAAARDPFPAGADLLARHHDPPRGLAGARAVPPPGPGWRGAAGVGARPRPRPERAAARRRAGPGSVAARPAAAGTLSHAAADRRARRPARLRRGGRGARNARRQHRPDPRPVPGQVARDAAGRSRLEPMMTNLADLPLDDDDQAVLDRLAQVYA